MDLNDIPRSRSRQLPALALMFTRPAAALSRLKEHPTWFAPLLCAATYSMAVNFYLIYRVGFARLITSMAKTNETVDPQTMLDAALLHRAQILSIQGVSTFAGTFLTAFVVAKALWLILSIGGDDVTFRRVMAVVSHVTLLTVAIRQTMLALTVTLIQDLDKLDFRNPLATNPAFFVPVRSAGAFRLMTSLDLVTFTHILLLALGLTKVSGRLSLRTACLIVLLPWSLYTGCATLIAISRFSVMAAP